MKSNPSDRKLVTVLLTITAIEWDKDVMPNITCKNYRLPVARSSKSHSFFCKGGRSMVKFLKKFWKITFKRKNIVIAKQRFDNLQLKSTIILLREQNCKLLTMVKNSREFANNMAEDFDQFVATAKSGIKFSTDGETWSV